MRELCAFILLPATSAEAEAPGTNTINADSEFCVRTPTPLYADKFYATSFTQEQEQHKAHTPCSLTPCFSLLNCLSTDMYRTRVSGVIGGCSDGRGYGHKENNRISKRRTSMQRTGLSPATLHIHQHTCNK